jgi:predicted permease
MRRAIYCGLVCAAIGFGVAAWVSTLTPTSSPRWMSAKVAFILFPAAVVNAFSMTDPDSGIWFLNALIYGAVGYTFWLFFMGDDPTTASKKDGSGRPLDP